MFNKQANPPPPQPPAPRPEPPPVQPEAAVRRPPTAPARAPSMLGADLVFEGTISGEGELHIDGAVRGDIKVARVTVGENARVEGTLRGATVEVRGQVRGDIEAKTVKLYESGHVEGDIVHEQLSIDAGAFFQGRASRPKRQAVITPPHTPASAQAPASTPAPTPVQTAKVVELDKNVG